MNFEELDKKIDEIYGSLTTEEVRRKFAKYGYNFDEKITVEKELCSQLQEFSTFEEDIFKIKNDNSSKYVVNMLYLSEAA